MYVKKKKKTHMPRLTDKLSSNDFVFFGFLWVFVQIHDGFPDSTGSEKV